MRLPFALNQLAVVQEYIRYLRLLLPLTSSLLPSHNVLTDCFLSLKQIGVHFEVAHRNDDKIQKSFIIKPMSKTFFNGNSSIRKSSGRKC